MNELYLVTMHRWGSSETHNYIRFVADTQEEAEKDALEHVNDRDGKYDAVVWKLTPNKRAQAICTYGGFGDRERHEGNSLSHQEYDYRFEEANVMLSEVVEQVEKTLSKASASGCYDIGDYGVTVRLIDRIKKWQEKQGRKIGYEKVVINDRHSGFGVSQEALSWLIENKGWKCIEIVSDECKDNERYKYQIHKCGEELFLNRDFFGSEESLRGNADLVEMVETLKEKSWDEYSSLKVIEVPDDAIWQIEEFDGLEYVAEHHRVWG